MNKTKRTVIIGLLCALAYVFMAISHLLPPMITALPFLKYDPKDVIIVIGGFIFDPLASLVISVIVSLVEMLTLSTTGPIGLLMNILSSAAFCCTAAFVYKKKRTLGAALFGLALACVFCSGIMLLWNYFITPLYTGQSVADILIPLILPFNLIKCTINAALTMALYKPLCEALRKTNLLPRRENALKPKHQPLGMIISFLILLASIFSLLIINNGFGA